jgi:hypothetical protein
MGIAMVRCTKKDNGPDLSGAHDPLGADSTGMRDGNRPRVMVEPGSAIHDFAVVEAARSWMAGTNPAKTQGEWHMSGWAGGRAYRSRPAVR